jgi:hypothetical protein
MTTYEVLAEPKRRLILELLAQTMSWAATPSASPSRR